MTNNTRRADGAGKPNANRKRRIESPRLHDVLCALGHDGDSVVSVNTNPPGDSGAFRATTRTVGSLREWTPPDDANVWFSPNPLKELLPKGGRGRREDVASGLTLYADLDVKEGALASMDECAAVVDKLAAALGVAPVVVIHSGHGLQPIWRVKQPNPITDDGTTWITISERWGVLVRDTVAEVNPSAATDSTFNIDRILRCPGSTNWKDEAAPVPAWCELDGDAGWLVVSDLALVLPDFSGEVPSLSKRGTDDQAQALTAAFRGGAMSPAVTKRVNIVLEAIETGNLRHESMNSAVQGLVRLGAERHSGVPAALDLLRAAFSAVSGTRGDPDEFDRSLRGALRNVAGSVDHAALSFDAGSAFEPGGIWHRDTGWIRDGDYWVRGVGESAAEPESVPPLSSWLPADVAAALNGDGPPTPTVLNRDDGACLFYAGKVHSVHGESESGKSWVVQCAAAQELIGDGSVLYLDFEDDVAGVANRLAQLGVPRDVLADRARFLYVHPEESLAGEPAREAFKSLTSQPFTFAVVDGVTDAMGVFGYSVTDNDDIAAWQRELPRATASRTGAAVACVDHVTKDAESRGRFAIGGQHKIAGLDGAAFVVEVERPFGVGMAGVASIRVGKDRPGHVRKMGVGWRKGDRTQRVGSFLLDSTVPGSLAWALKAPDESAPDEKAATVGGGPFRPTWFMEQVSLYWEKTDNPTERTQNKTVQAMCAERKAAGKKENRQKWREAVDLLVAEGFAVVETGPRGANCHRVGNQYRQTTDPQADGYTGGRTIRLQVVGNDASAISSDGGSQSDCADRARTVP